MRILDVLIVGMAGQRRRRLTIIVIAIHRAGLMQVNVTAQVSAMAVHRHRVMMVVERMTGMLVLVVVVEASTAAIMVMQRRDRHQ